MTRKITRKEQAKITKDHILEVSLKMMAEKDIESIRIQDICQSSQVSVGSFYHHFGDKSGIIIEAYKQVDQKFLEEILPELSKLDPYNSIIEYLCAQCGHAVNLGPQVIKHIYKAQIDHGNIFFGSYERGLPQGLHKLIVRAIDSGDIQADTDAKELGEELLSISRGCIYRWCIKNGDFNLQEFIFRIAENYLKAYKNK